MVKKKLYSLKNGREMTWKHIHRFNRKLNSNKVYAFTIHKCVLYCNYHHIHMTVN